MTPSEPSSVTALAPASSAVPSAGFPDLGAITSMAREMFAALSPGMPGALPMGTTSPSTPSLPSPPALGTPAHPTLPSPSRHAMPPTEADLRALPGALAAPLGLPNPVIAGAAPASPTGADSSFYFLRDLRPPSSGGSFELPRDFGAQASPFASPSSSLPASSLPASSLPVSAAPASAPLAAGGHPVHPVSPSTSPPGSVPARSPSGELGFVSQGFAPELVPDLSDVGRKPGAFDAHAVRRDFPILDTTINGRPLIWLDNAATTQKPRAVIERLKAFYENENSNIHRAAHTLAARATDAYESAREKTRRFLKASSSKEIIFVRGTTEGINLVAKSWGHRHIGAGDEIVITWLEHHANIVPWQQLCAEKGARLRVAPVDDDGQILLDEYEKLLNPRTRLVSLSQVSNALGTITPAQKMVESAHRVGAKVLVDGAQAVSHMPVDVQALGCDFYVFSGHKVFGPTGIGVVYGTAAILEETPPWQGGGNMIVDVTFEKTVYQPPPARFEAGTGNIADAVGLGAAIDYVESLGMENIARYEHELLVYATRALKGVPGLTLIGTAPDKAGVLSFVLDGFRTEDVGAALDREGIAVRSGHHCAQPILRRFGLETSVRPSLAPYNTCEDIDALEAALHRLVSGAPSTSRTASSSR